jgi:hypothetical protein
VILLFALIPGLSRNSASRRGLPKQRLQKSAEAKSPISPSLVTASLSSLRRSSACYRAWHQRQEKKGSIDGAKTLGGVRLKKENGRVKSSNSEFILTNAELDAPLRSTTFRVGSKTVLSRRSGFTRMAA